MKNKNLIVLSLLSTLLVCTAFASFANAADDISVSSATAPVAPPESGDASTSEPIIAPLRPDEPIHPDMDITFTAPNAPTADEPNLISTNTASDSVTASPSDSPKPVPPSKTTETDEPSATELPIHPNMDIAYTAQNENTAKTANATAVGEEANLISARVETGGDDIWVILGIMAVLAAGLSSVLGVVLYRRVPIKK
ncbi:MAG: hypothetical protein ACQCN3_12715 [Candidatus Bathyarchaeia archaeon]